MTNQFFSLDRFARRKTQTASSSTMDTELILGLTAPFMEFAYCMPWGSSMQRFTSDI
jgi:hypothetical protein